MCVTLSTADDFEELTELWEAVGACYSSFYPRTIYSEAQTVGVECLSS